MKIKYLAICMVLLCCIMGAASAADDVSADLVDASIDDAVSEDLSDSLEQTVVEDEQVVDDSASAQDGNYEEISQSSEGDGNNRQNPQTYDINDETSYNQYIGTYGLNGNAGDTYNFVSDFTGKTVYIDKDNTTITSASGVVLTNCGFSINSGVSGVTINGLNIQNTISSYPIYVGPNCSDISITNNNILVNYTSASQSYLYGIDFNAYDWATNITYNFNNIDITDNTITMYGNSYVCGIYGSNFINSNVLRNTIYAYSDTTSTSAGNNAAYGIALCDDSTWAVVSRPQNNKIANNNVTCYGQLVHGIEDFGISQNVSNNYIKAVANTTGYAYGIALGIMNDSIINNNTVYLTPGDLSNANDYDMIRGGNSCIRLFTNSAYGYFNDNVNITNCILNYNTYLGYNFATDFIKNDDGNTNCYFIDNYYSYFYSVNPLNLNVNVNNVLNINSKVKDILGATGSDVLRDSSVIYVDPVNGNDNNDGFSNSTAVQSINTALNKVSDGGTIILNEGTYAGMIMPQKSVSFVGVNRENTIISAMVMAQGSGFIGFSNLTVTSMFMLSKSSNLTNVDFKINKAIMLQSTTSGSYYNILNCSFINTSIVFAGAPNAYDVNINSSTFINKDGVISGDMYSSLSINYCSFVNCKNLITVGANKNVNIANSYFGMNDAPSISNVTVTDWVVMTFENTTELNLGEDAGFLVSFKKLAHADGTFTELEHPELLALPSYDVTYTLIDGTEVTHTLENLEDASTLAITGYGTIKATAAGQTLKILYGKDITLDIEKYDAIGYGGEQDLVFISNYKDITGTMTVTITGPDYSKEQALDIYGGRAFLTLKDLNVGEYTVEVAYSGDEIYYPKSASTTFNVMPVESDDITLKVYVNNITFSEAADILVFVGPKGATGNVTITIDGNDTTEDLDGNGIASFSIKGLPVKDYTVTVKYNGDSNFESATTTAAFSVSANPIIDDLNTQLNQTKEELATVSAEAATAKEQVANLTADVASAQEQVANLTADVASAQEQVANLTADVAKVQEQVTQLTQENAKLTGDLSTANKNAATASNNANAKIKKIKAAKTVKKSKKYVITVTLNKKVKGKYVFVAFNGKTYKAKTNAKGIAKVTIKKSVLKKLAGKKVKYQVISGNSLKNKAVKIKK